MSRPRYAAVFDFDGTLTPKEFISCFNTVENSLFPKYRQELNRMREEYLPKATDGQLTPEEIKKWIFRSIEIYIESGLTLSKIKDMLSPVRLRTSVKNTLNFLYHREIPVAIISFGVRQFIEAITEREQVKNFITAVYALDLTINQDLVSGWNPETFVCPENKGDWSRFFAVRHCVTFDRILAVGDSAVDCRLGHLPENRLGIAQNQAEKEKIEKYFGEVVITETFDPVLEWLKRKINST